MNENKLKVRLGSKSKRNIKHQSYWIKPSGKFWKRLMNKRVRQGATYKKINFWYWD